MKWNKTILAAAAVVLPLSAGIGTALSYFTANDEAVGGYEVVVGAPDTEIEEGFYNWKKEVRITNKADSDVPVYVRVKAFSGSEYPLEYTYGTDGEGNPYWRYEEDGYYYYNSILGIGEATEILNIEIKDVPDASVSTDKDKFNVIVIYERTSAVKDDGKGNLVPDWDFAVKMEDKVLNGDSAEEGGNNQ